MQGNRLSDPPTETKSAYFIPQRVLRWHSIAAKLRLQLNLTCTCKLCIVAKYTLRVQKLTESARWVGRRGVIGVIKANVIEFLLS